MSSLLESNLLPLGTGSAEAETLKTISGLNFNGSVPPSPVVPWPPSPPSELVQAVNLVARAVNGRIAVLQAEIDQLRRALQPFKAMGQPNSQDVFAGGDDAVNELLAIARKLGGNNAS